jgi:uncharacterized membrane protein
MSNASNVLPVEPPRQLHASDASTSGTPRHRIDDADAAPEGGDGDAVADSPFNFRISPNISMGPTSMVAMLGVFAVPVTGLAIMAAALGYWPVSLFGGFWFGVLVLAMIRSRLSLQRCEQIFLEGNAIVVERTTHRGRATRFRVPLYGVRLESFLDPDYGLLRLTLLHRSSRVDIARDLSPDERSSFRTAFIRALDVAGHSMPLVTLRAPELLAPESST